MAGTLDFIVIGAQKAGTTSLWHYLSSHPQLHFPPSKEAPFFGWNERYRRGLEWYLEEFFAAAPADALWGTASPQYMTGTTDADPGEIARRIAATAPDAHLIAILRDPVERARSHHRMMTHRGQEKRSFAGAVRKQLKSRALKRARAKPTETTSYVVQGEYGRILGTYLEHFPRDRLHVATSDDLAADPAGTLAGVLRFLGVDSTHSPADLGRRYFLGGTRRRLSEDAEAALTEYLAREVWPCTTRPGEQKRSFDMWFRTFNVLPDEDGSSLDPKVAETLRAHYTADNARLEQLTGLRTPWGQTVDSDLVHV